MPLLLSVNELEVLMSLPALISSEPPDPEPFAGTSEPGRGNKGRSGLPDKEGGCVVLLGNLPETLRTVLLVMVI